MGENLHTYSSKHIKVDVHDSCLDLVSCCTSLRFRFVSHGVLNDSLECKVDKNGSIFSE